MVNLFYVKTSPQTCNLRIAQCSLFVCGLWLCLLFWPGLFNDMVINMSVFDETFLKRQCCVQ